MPTPKSKSSKKLEQVSPPKGSDLASGESQGGNVLLSVLTQLCFALLPGIVVALSKRLKRAKL